MKHLLLAMTGISKRFPGVTALDKVSLEVDGGEIVALVGENGAGKSTLMRILAGIESPDNGSIRVLGSEVILQVPRDAARLGIVIIHQELELIDTLDIAANVFLGRESLWGGPLRLLDRKRMEAACEVELRRLGLQRSPRTLVSQLSMAERQLVEIAKALSARVRLLIMDEPTSSLTSSEAERLFSIVRELKAQGVGIVYISHRMAEVEALADRVVVLRDGKNAGSLPRHQIQREAMVRLMVGRDLSYAGRPAAKEAVGNPILEIRELRTGRYPSSPINLACSAGEILGLAGLVGAGRSEVLRAAFGVDAPISGSVVVDGTVVPRRQPKEAIARGIFLLPEDRRNCGLLTSWSIRKNVTLPQLRRFARAGIVRPASERESASRYCESLKVKAPSVETTAAHLSGGNQQKVVLAKGMALKPRAVLFDEPTRGVDVGSKAELYALMRQLADSGAAVVVASSDMEEILAITDRVAVMREGRITGILQRAEYSPESVMRLAVGE
jgi:ribose transport system ATP-binding protein